MKREIKFRGKDGCGTWFFGDLHQWDNGEVYIGVHSSTWSDDGLSSQSYPTFNEIDPNTVGQFTGLYDKNGKEIYEGDIVKEKEFGIVGYIAFHKQSACFRIVFSKSDIALGNRGISGTFLEVIGNVTDNPELLKGGEK